MVHHALCGAFALGALAACTSTNGACPVTLGSPLAIVAIGGQVRAPISLIDSSVHDAREIAVGQADVALADLQALPLPGIHALSAADGSYSLPRTLMGYAYVITARVKLGAGGTKTLRTLADVGSNGATADVNIASTLLATALTHGLSGQPGRFDHTAYERAVALVYQHLVVEGSPDPADAAAVVTREAAWEAVDAELKGLGAGLRAALGANQPAQADLLAQLGVLWGQTAAPDHAATSP